MNTSRIYHIFVSSVQKELADQRREIDSFIKGDALLRQFFKVFLFEDLPASDHRVDEVYLAQVNQCDVYVGLFGNDYGHQDADGISPTEREFTRATEAGKTRLIFVTGADDAARHPKMQQLIGKASNQIIRRRFNGTAELTAQVYASLVDFLQDRGIIKNRPFDDMGCLDATIDDIDHAAVTAFVRRARDERQFPFDPSTPTNQVLTHLGLLRENHPTHAAILLFGRNPQQFIPCAEVRCMHFHGVEIQRPAPFYRIFKGTLFSQVDQAANFVLSVINLSVGTRALGTQAPVGHEIPPDVVREAIVNALAHRDYASGAAVQVAVFADRIEVWNPGELLPPLTPESLRHPHRSVARNHRVCESLFLAGYIEKYGTGTLMMIRESLAHALPEPIFQQQGGEFSTVIGRDWLTEKILAGLNLNDRQAKAVLIAKKGGRLDNKEYQKLFSVTKPTASRDLDELAAKGIFAKIGTTGKGTHYILSPKGLTKGSMGSQRAQIVQTREQDINETFSQGSCAPGSESTPFFDTESTANNKLNNNEIQIKSQRSVGRKPRKNHAGAGTVTGEVEAYDARQAPNQLPTSTPPVTLPVTPPVRSLIQLLGKHGELGAFAVREALGLKDRAHVREAYLNPSLEAGYTEYTIPDKPCSSKQKYRLTEKGRNLLAERK